MSLDLNVANNISENIENVTDQNGNSSALSLATTSALVFGADVVGSSMPLTIIGAATLDEGLFCDSIPAYYCAA